MTHAKWSPEFPGAVPIKRWDTNDTILLMNKLFWGLVVVGIIVYFTKHILVYEYEKWREGPEMPHFTLEDTSVKEKSPAKYAIEAVFTNEGVVAKDIVHRFIHLEMPAGKCRLRDSNFTDSIAVGEGKKYRIPLWPIIVTQDRHPVFFKFELKYTDMLKKRLYTQPFHLRFPEKSKDTYRSKLYNATKEEADKIDDCIAGSWIELL